MPMIDPAAAGPYDTDADADDASPFGQHGALRGLPYGEDWKAKIAFLTGVCQDDAGLGLGGYDHRILRWLAGWEPSVIQVIAGLIARAAAGPLEYGVVTPPLLLASYSPAYATREAAQAEAARTGGQLVCRTAARPASLWRPVP